MTGPEVLECADPVEVAGSRILRAVEGSIARTGRCRLALSGGGTPGPVYRWLARRTPASVYASLHVTLVDERIDGSNLDLVRTTWLDSVGARPAAVLPMVTGLALFDEADRFGAAFDLGFDGGLDVAVLGVGPDGHVASLFPGHPALEATGSCVALRDSPKPPPERLSLTMPVLEAARTIALVATGPEKGPVLARALAGDRSIPLGRLRPRGEWVWILDRAAASAIA